MRTSIVTLIVPLVASALPSESLAQKASNQTRRFAADSFWNVQWKRGYEKEPDLVVEPRELSTVGDRLLVLDAGTREVLILDASTGKSIRRFEARGNGPGEFKRPVSLTPLSNGFAILDQSVNRLSALSFDGKLLWDVQSPSFTAAACAHSPTQLTWKARGAKNAIVVMDTAGRTLLRASIPWPDLPGQDMGTNAAVAGPSSGGACVFARTHGPGFVIRQPNGVLTTHQYIEPTPEPRIEVKRQTVERSGDQSIVQETQVFNGVGSAMKAMIVRDTLIVQFSGSTAFKYRMLDYYHLPSGRYIHSRKLRAPAVAVTAGANGAFYLSEMLEEYSGIVAIRPSRTPPPKTPARN
jgi:hypothetical protein